MLERKKPNVDLRKSYTVYLQIGLIVTLLILLGLFKFEFKPAAAQQFVAQEQETVKMEEIEQTEQVTKPPPPPRPPSPVEVPNDEIIEDEILDLDAELDLDAPMDMPPPPEEDLEEEDEIFLVVEQQPNVDGGITQQIYKHLKYPEIAQKAGIEGRVVVQFVVNENGKVVQPVVVRGIGGGCDEAAVGAIQKLDFTPGMQRGRPVKVRMTVPVVFKLQN